MIGIQRLLIHRFRGIREGVLEDLGKINLLIGPNNSGKTSILEMIYLAGLSGRRVAIVGENIEYPKQEQEGSEKGQSSAEKGKEMPQTQISNEMENKENEQTSSFPAIPLEKDFLHYRPFERLLRRHEHEKHTMYAYHVALYQGSLLFELDRLPKGSPLKNFQMSLELPPYGIGGFTEEDKYEVRMFSLVAPEEHPVKPPTFFDQRNVQQGAVWHYLWDGLWVYRHPPFEVEKDEKGKERILGVSYLSIWVIEGQLPAPDKVLFLDFHSATEPFKASFAQASFLNLPAWEEEIGKYMGSVFPELEGCRVSIKPTESGTTWTGYVQQGKGKPVEIGHFGDGARHAFKVLATLIALAESVDENHPGLFLWEDPELFMHPATLGRLLDTVMGIVADKPIQVFMTTQSLEVIAWLVGFLEKDIIQPSDIRTYRLNLTNGLLKVMPFKGKEIAGWIEFIGDPRMEPEEEMNSPLAKLLRDRRQVL